MNIRNEKIAAAIRRHVQTQLSRGLNDPRISGMLSVTAVRLSDDLAEAVVSVSILPEDGAELTMHGLRHAAVHLQTQMGQALALRRTPRLVFKLDHSMKKQAAVEAALASIRRADAAESPQSPDAQESQE